MYNLNKNSKSKKILSKLIKQKPVQAGKLIHPSSHNLHILSGNNLNKHCLTPSYEKVTKLQVH